MPMRLTLVVLLALTLHPIARADEASKNTKIQELFTVTHVDRIPNQMTDGMLGQMTNQLKQQTAGADLNAKQQEIVSGFMSKVSTIVRGQLTWDKVKAQFTTLYAAAYTEPELDALLTFYRSPAGQTMLAKTPELTSKGYAIGQAQFGTLSPQLRQMSQEFAQQMTAAATPRTPPAGSSPAPAPSKTPSPSH